ncbi:hypothetical protein [Marinomonas rhodophyticola]|uniref:DprA winged helix domain-containing protein n=1 Tax=Marinomonas rhodophyticola TaxID=2992803 RepID=A0ABT3KIC9_9GAMM|nr:hypothetical protein [Marinomonas sp. KJ51-3]MCW4630309.1 hypothetical protein [Marinomonas sp. KJ51-3]
MTHTHNRKSSPADNNQAPEIVPPPVSNAFHALPKLTSDNAKMIIKIMEQEGQAMDFDALIRQSKMDAGLMMQVLMELELYGCLENREGLYYRC